MKIINPSYTMKKENEPPVSVAAKWESGDPMARDEIIKALRQFIHQFDGRDVGDYFVEDVLETAADLLEQDAPGWISVKDRLPETSGYYLVCTLTAFYHTQCISKVYFSGSIWGSIRKRYTNVTHWMSLPEPPEEEK